jgi:PPOX class probable F420-dependent enzyme
VHGIEVEAVRRSQEAGPVAEGEAGGQEPEAFRAARGAQGLGSAVTADRAWALARLAEARIGRLGTVGPEGDARLVPVCFAVDGERIVSAVDHKPKTTRALARLADISRTGRASLLVDHYDDADWSALWWVRVTGAAAVSEVGEPAARAAIERLAAKYDQYAATPPQGPVYAVTIEHVQWWRAGAPATSHDGAP